MSGLFARIFIIGILLFLLKIPIKIIGKFRK